MASKVFEQLARAVSFPTTHLSVVCPMTISSTSLPTQENDKIIAYYLWEDSNMGVPDNVTLHASNTHLYANGSLKLVKVKTPVSKSKLGRGSLHGLIVHNLLR